MCFNWQVSLFTFSLGLIFSLLLIYKGNKKYNIQNKITGIFLIFIITVQFMDFLLWIDIKNTFGINKIMTILGPLITEFPPVVFYIIKYLYYRPNIFSPFHLFIFLLNLLYTIYFIIIYKKILLINNLITGIENNHLKWKWIEYFNPSFYPILLAINIFYLFDFKYALFIFIITYLFFYLSFKYFNYNVGELWCFFGSFIPLILYFASYYII